MVACKKQLLVFGGFHENSRLVTEQHTILPARYMNPITEKRKITRIGNVFAQSALGKAKKNRTKWVALACLMWGLLPPGTLSTIATSTASPWTPSPGPASRPQALARLLAPPAR